MKKYINFINGWLIDISELLKNVLVFAVICGLLFNDPFGIINTISNLISGVGEKGLAGFISLAILILTASLVARSMPESLSPPALNISSTSILLAIMLNLRVLYPS